jgi:hypothetical protein
MLNATIVAHSKSEETGIEVVSAQLTFHRFILPEFNTHTAIVKNSASSRAIPVVKQIERIMTSLAYPVRWPSEQRGMQGGEDIPLHARIQAENNWEALALESVTVAQRLQKLGVHKSVVNRVLEPFMWHTVIATATAWENFFDQRVSELAQPEMNAIATLLQKALSESTPEMTGEGMWHTPYVDADEREWLLEHNFDPREISSARCARTSYLTQEGKRDPSEDEKLYQRLVTAKPPHSSPLGHVCTPAKDNVISTVFEDPDEPSRVSGFAFVTPRVGQLLGWQQWRHVVEGRNHETSFR